MKALCPQIIETHECRKVMKHVRELNKKTRKFSCSIIFETQAEWTTKNTADMQ
jgi:hypothetical protein